MQRPILSTRSIDVSTFHREAMDWSNEAGETTTEGTSNMTPEELTALKLNRTSGTKHQDIDDATRFLRGTQMKTMGVQKRDVGIQAFTSLLRFEHTLSRQYGKGSFVLHLSSFVWREMCGLKGVLFFLFNSLSCFGRWSFFPKNGSIFIR